ncbi:MAG TPA: hypothetical protein VG983_03100 [Caulobacterales bacterium]|jgi:hypothetical protein|nr:hypothetical protein [Caulobacterales bacterium]
MRFVILAAFALAASSLAACATPSAPAASHVAADARDCAVMAAVLTQHYKIAEGSPLHLQRGDPNDPEAYRITCDFKAVGAPIEDYDYERPSTVQNFQGWLNFAPPSYPTLTTAIIETGSLLGPLAGSGQKCTLHKGDGGWTVDECKMTWIS